MAKSKATPGTGATKKVDALGEWIAIGVGVGVAFGALFGQIGLGIALGAAFGVIIGSALASRGDGRRADRRDPDA